MRCMVLMSLSERIVKNRNKNVTPTERNLMRREMQRLETAGINKLILTRVHDEFRLRRTKEIFLGFQGSSITRKPS